ncbi:uncharacterized protein LOC143637105 isoform X2 [Bidens hawaiensis]|uniref:uncharacterized protein LOC143637105 isoform X2 n=1 Tax=Bidens hawaiensis TaxID=980011 RepID=UPI004049E3E8
MVVLTHARQLRLNPPPSATISSVIYDPTSLSLALMHSDSSFSLYPHISPFSPPPPSTTTTVVSPPSSSATFLRLRTTTDTDVMFIVSSPYLAGTSILLRFYIIRNDNQFARVRVICNQSDLVFDEKRLGVLVKVNHGVSVKLAASINVFAMYSFSDRKVRVFAVKGVGDGDVVKLMRTAVIDCESPVFAVSVSTGFLSLGEEGGVRVFPLRPLVKGRKVSDKPKVQKLKLVNGMVSGIGGSGLYAKTGKFNGSMDRSAKLKPLKLRQNSQECGVRFVPFKSKEFEDYESSKGPLMMSIKAVSIQFLAHNKFLILDSDGELYLLSLSNHASGSESGHEMKKLTLTMKVQNLAVLPDDSASPKTVWLSDGQYTIHAIILSDMDSTAANENETNIEEKIQRSATQVIFTSEKIQEIVPLSANAILLLGQANNIFAYAIS